MLGRLLCLATGVVLFDAFDRNDWGVLLTATLAALLLVPFDIE